MPWGGREGVVAHPMSLNRNNHAVERQNSARRLDSHKKKNTVSGEKMSPRRNKLLNGPGSAVRDCLAGSAMGNPDLAVMERVNRMS